MRLAARAATSWFILATSAQPSRCMGGSGGSLVDMLRYPVKLEPDREVDGYVVTVPDVPGVITEGDTVEQSLERAADALELVLSVCPERGLDIPRPGRSRSKGVKYVSVSALAATKLSLYSAWRESGVTKAELASRIGIHKTDVAKLFDL
ncbi:MAG: type II toxin-antitoxin system HicB family antitoxin [bacterium]|nr:type II toxin-antitoxin system HicB family antitoxin [bacterium]